MLRIGANTRGKKPRLRRIAPLATIFMVFRVLHTFVHVGFLQTGNILIVRFSLFAVQFVCLAWMGIYLIVALV